MSNSAIWQADFEKYKICVLIPTYNNAGSIGQVIKDISGYTTDILIVNDGSTDGTAEIISGFPFVKLLSYSPNRGKGWALRQGFKFALSSGFDYAITIDSDGQHFADDLPSFVNDLKTNGDAIIIGARNMEQHSVPGKSSRGNRISSYWFHVETGIKMSDTQSGYRLYPIRRMSRMKWITRKFEFEIEVLVRSSWQGIVIRSVPVKVYYAPKAERVSHFRPIKDFTRISILNSILVLIAFLWIKPRDFYRLIFQKKKFKEVIQAQFFNTGQSDARKSFSIAFGVFMGIIPIWGFQLMAAIFLAVLFRLNKALVIIAANISIPPMIPLIIFLSYKMGGWWMGDRVMSLSFSGNINLDTIKENLEQYIYGSITLAIIAALLAGLIAWAVLKVSKSTPSRQVVRNNNR
jgi:glycosyltransferase involved in cell wall biosynthesis